MFGPRERAREAAQGYPGSINNLMARPPARAALAGSIGSHFEHRMGVRDS
jgi:hypothetical protein